MTSSIDNLMKSRRCDDDVTMNAMHSLCTVSLSLVLLLTIRETTASSKNTGNPTPSTSFQGHIRDLGWNDSEVAAAAGRLVVVLQAFDRDAVGPADNGDVDAEQPSGSGVDTAIGMEASATDNYNGNPPTKSAMTSSEALQTYDQPSANDELPLTSSSDCHRLEMTEARAAVLRKRPGNDPLRTHIVDERPDVDENSQLLEELRRRFATNRTIVLCKPSQPYAISHQPPDTSLTSRSAAAIEPSRSVDGASQNDETKSSRPVPPRHVDTILINGRTRIKSTSVHQPSRVHEHLIDETSIGVGDVNRVAHLHISETERYPRTGTDRLRHIHNGSRATHASRAATFEKSRLSHHRHRNQHSSTDVTPSTEQTATTDSIHSSLPFHHLRHPGRRNRRDKHHRDHRSDNSTGGGGEGVNTRSDDGYFRCHGRRYPKSRHYMERLESALQEYRCWNNDDQLTEFDTASGWSTQSHDRLCQLRLRFERCRRDLASRAGHVAGVGRSAGSGRREHRGDRHGLPDSWSRQVSDIMDPAKNISMIFY